MTTFLMRPLSPLVFRRGVAFGDDSGADGGEVHRLPLPGTVAGAVRAAWADGSDWPFKDAADHADLRQGVRVAGPLYVQSPIDGATVGPRVLVPAPADALLAERRLVNGSLSRAYLPMQPWQVQCAGTDLGLGLCPVDVFDDVNGWSMLGDDDSLWPLDKVTQWLSEQTAMGEVDVSTVQPLAHHRKHVALDADRQAIDQHFYQSTGTDFGSRIPDETSPFVWSGYRHDLLVEVQLTAERTKERELAVGRAALSGRVRTVGGEGRACHFEAAPAGLWPAPDPDLMAALDSVSDGALLRLMIVTPALLDQGWLPSWLSHDQDLDWICGTLPYANLKVQLVAVRNNEWVPWAGLDMSRPLNAKTREVGGRSRPIARLVPAGSVYWLRLLETPRPGDFRKCWLQPMEPGGQPALDGHGLMLIGVGAMAQEGP